MRRCCMLGEFLIFFFSSLSYGSVVKKPLLEHKNINREMVRNGIKEMKNKKDVTFALFSAPRIFKNRTYSKNSVGSEYLEVLRLIGVYSATNKTTKQT